MPKPDMLKKILNTVETLQDSVQTMQGSIHGLEKSVHSLEDRMTSVEDTVDFIKENAVTKDELHKTAKHLEDTIANHTDRFIGMHQTHEIEIASLRSGYKRLDSDVHTIKKHLRLKTTS